MHTYAHKIAVVRIISQIMARIVPRYVRIIPAVFGIHYVPAMVNVI